MAGDIEFDEDAVLAQVNRLIGLFEETERLRVSLTRLGEGQTSGQWSGVASARAFAERVGSVIVRTGADIQRIEARLRDSAQNLLDTRSAYEQQDDAVRARFDALARLVGATQGAPSRRSV